MAQAAALPAAEEAQSLDSLLRALQLAEQVTEAWADPAQRLALAELRAAEAALQREAIRRLIKGLQAEPLALQALREVAGDEVVYAVLRRHGLIKPSLQERVETALASIRPMLAGHGGDVELVQLLPPAGVEVRFLGNCDHCPASVLTFTAGVKRAIREHCPEITEIRQASGLGVARPAAAAVDFVSPFVQHRTGIWHRACLLDQVPDGGALPLALRGEALLLSRAGSRVACYVNACAHLAMPLDGGRVADGVITCPHHGFQYDLASGECLTAPEVQLEPRVVRVIGGMVEVQLAGAG